jgi:N-acetylglucosaminyldiphosphoundecaprenol N-acetyl-beta-D-mannosaminyltransferase
MLHAERPRTRRSRVSSSLARPLPAGRSQLTVLGVTIADVAMSEAVEIVHSMLRRRDSRARSVYFVNAHSLNVAAADRAYRDVLNAGDIVFGDGTGVRWAARLRGVRLRDNVNGTDLVPALLAATAGFGYRYFLLGADEESIDRAADHAAAAFPGWTLTGRHHGYLTNPDLDAEAVDRINRARPDLLLVGMGNPLQERWIEAHRSQLAVPVCLGVGGLFQYWAGTLRRAPRWLRGRGFEWLGILAQQPSKARRYLLGNPLFLARALYEAGILRRRQRRLRETSWGGS